MTDPKRTTDPEADVELGARVETNPKTARMRGAVMAVRLSPDLLARLNEYAIARHLTVSEVIRRAAEQLVSGVGQAQGAVYQTGALLVGPGIVHGSLTTGTGQSLRREAVDEPEDESSLTR